MTTEASSNGAATTELPVYKAKDFTTDQDVRWCPGCGDYAVLAAVRKTLPKLGRRKEDYVFVSGIGCAARFPYYMETYGLHSIHGRAPAFATGIKLAQPDLDVWLVSGDGDLLSIGGNHLIHSMRRNVGINLILLNNRIYGLTKVSIHPPAKRARSPSQRQWDLLIRLSIQSRWHWQLSAHSLHEDSTSMPSSLRQS